MIFSWFLGGGHRLSQFSWHQRIRRSSMDELVQQNLRRLGRGVASNNQWSFVCRGCGVPSPSNGFFNQKRDRISWRYIYTLWLFNTAMEKSLINGGFNGKIIYKWAIFPGYVK
jgi:hypothetical protein